MKKIVIFIMLILMMATPVYAVSAVDTMMCKKVFLRAIERTVLVNRMSGEVKYIMRNGQWIPLTGEHKHEIQSMYNAQLYNQKQSNK